MNTHSTETPATAFPAPVAPAMSGSGATDAVPSATAGQFGSIEHGNDTPVTLDDKYLKPRGRVYMTGTQALVRLLLAQKQRDEAAGLNTGGFVSGYRGSPLGAVDQELWKARKHLDANNIKFIPGPQRGTRRHLGVGLADGQPRPEGQGRRRVRAVVRQGPGRRPQRRRLQARQHRRLLEARRRAARSPATTTPASRRACRTRASMRSSPR